jgi:hypothetical protein
MEKDSIVAVANFIEKNPELKAKAEQLDPSLFHKATIIKNEQAINKAAVQPPVSTNRPNQ